MRDDGNGLLNADEDVSMEERIKAKREKEMQNTASSEKVNTQYG